MWGFEHSLSQTRVWTLLVSHDLEGKHPWNHTYWYVDTTVVMQTEVQTLLELHTLGRSHCGITNRVGPVHESH